MRIRITNLLAASRWLLAAPGATLPAQGDFASRQATRSDAGYVMGVRE